MKINDKYPVDVASVIKKFAEEGLSLDLLRKCNAQSFKVINGYGEGWFLFTSDQVIDDSELVTLNMTDTFALDGPDPLEAYFELHVLNKLTLHHPDQTDTYLYILHTAEEKFILNSANVARNYNMVKRNEIATGDYENYYNPDSSPMTLEDIIEDIVAPATLSYNGPTVIPIEVNIQGLSVFEAVESLCRAHGLFWTMREGDVNVFGSTTVPEVSYDKLIDIRKPIRADNAVEVVFIHPVIASGLQRNSRYYLGLAGTLDTAVQVYMPFYPAMYKTGDTYAASPVNQLDIAALVLLLGSYIRAALEIEDYYHVQEHYNLLNGVFGAFSATVCFTLTFGDYGAGPRTIYSAVKYPFHTVPQPYDFDGGESGVTIGAAVTLTATLASGLGSTSANATVNETNDPSAPATLTVYNTVARALGVGAKVTVIKIGEAWWLVESSQPSAIKLGITYAANHPTGLSTVSVAKLMSCNPDYAFDGGALPSTPFNAKDRFNLALNAKTGQKAIVEYDPVEGYYITNSQHTSWRVNGTVVSAFTGTPATFSVTPVTPLDGILPVGTLSVRNRFSWPSAAAAAKITIQWDSDANEYFAYQMGWTCP